MAPLCIIGFSHYYDVLPTQRAKIRLALVLQLDRESDLAKSVKDETLKCGQTLPVVTGDRVWQMLQFVSRCDAHGI